MNQRGQINSVIVKINMDGTENEPRFVVEEVTAQPGRCFEGAEKLLRARFECLGCTAGYVVLPLIMQIAPTLTEMEVSIAEHVSEDEIGSTLNEAVDSDEEQKQDHEFDDFKMEDVSSLHGDLYEMAAIENQSCNSVIVKINMDGTEKEPRFVVEELTVQPGRCFEDVENLIRARFVCLCCKIGYVVLPLIMQTAPILTEMEVTIAEDDQNCTLDQIFDFKEEQTQGDRLEDSEMEDGMTFPMNVDSDSVEMPPLEYQACAEQTSDSEKSEVLSPSEMQSLKRQCLLSKAVIRLVRVEEIRELEAPVAPLVHQERNTEDFYQCDICKASLKNRDSLYRHMKIHLGIRYSCSECSKSFSQNSDLPRHNQRFHKSEFRVCEVCRRSKTCTKAEYHSHLRRRHPEFRIKGRQPKSQNFNGVNFPCIYCEPQATFTSFRELKEHLGVTHVRNFACTRCPKAWDKQSNLKIHIETVHEERMFNCTKCDKIFTWKTNLKRHLHVHNK